MRLDFGSVIISYNSLIQFKLISHNFSKSENFVFIARVNMTCIIRGDNPCWIASTGGDHSVSTFYKNYYIYLCSQKLWAHSHEQTTTKDLTPQFVIQAILN